MASNTLQNMKNMLGMGARANKYRITLSGLQGVDDLMVDTFARSTEIPGRSFSEIDVWDQGRKTTILGNASFDGTWSVVFIDTEDHSLRRKFLDWMEYMDSVIKNSKTATSHVDYMTTSMVEQLSTIDNVITATYVFENVFPRSISSSSVSDENSSLIEFTVEFNYSSWSLL